MRHQSNDIEHLRIVRDGWLNECMHLIEGIRQFVPASLWLGKSRDVAGFTEAIPGQKEQMKDEFAIAIPTLPIALQNLICGGKRRFSCWANMLIFKLKCFRKNN